MTVCDLCKGTGKLLKPWYDTTGAMTGMTGDICFMCDGKGTIGEPMTNEEYMRSCDTEQLAEAIYYLTWFHTELDERLDKNVKNGRYNNDENIKIVVEWLKQPHTVKE